MSDPLPRPDNANAADGQAGGRPPLQLEYSTTTADPVADGEEMIALWRTGLSQDGMPVAKLEWYYCRNPEGTPLVVFLRHRSTPQAVAVATAGPRRFRFGAKILKAGALVDFVARPEHRTFFPAIFLQKELLRRARESHAILFGFPNAKSLAIVRRIGYRCVGQMVRRTRVLRSSAYLDKFLPKWLSGVVGAVTDGFRSAAMSLRTLVHAGFQSRWQDRPNDAFDQLWQRAVVPDVVIGFRDKAFLTWRFVDSPRGTFRFFVLESSTAPSLVAYAVCAQVGSALHVEDFLVDPALPSAGPRLWLDLSREAIRMGCTSLSVEFLGSDLQQRQLGALGLLAREQRPVYAFVAQSSGGEAVLPTAVSNWYLTSADDD